MKIPPARAETFLSGLSDNIHGILLYGPDSGLVRERAMTALKKVTGGSDDPFLIAEMTAAEIREDPARVTDEACALAFGGGRRAVRLRGAADGATKVIGGTLDTMAEASGPAPSLLIVEAGELGPRSSLRRLFEGADHGAAIACYLDEGAGLERLIESAFLSYELRVDHDALSWLAANLGADRGVTMGEVEKLALYCAGAKKVTLEDCRAVVGEAAAHDLEDAVFAAASGECEALDLALARAFQEGVNTIAILRASQRHFQRLHLVCGEVAGGTSLDAAVKGLKPPVFFKLAERFRGQTRRWNPNSLARAIDLLTDAELRCKSTGQPDRLICQRTLMQIANAARQAGRQ